MMDFIVVIITSALALVSASEFLSQSISVQEVEDSVRVALSTVTTGISYSDISSVLEPTFHALPKNKKGLLESGAVEYLVQSYFAKEHGWHINGLGSRQSQSQFESRMNLVEGTSILQAMAPAAIEAVLKAKNGNRGFTLRDTVAMVAAIENLVLRESQVLLETVYTKFEMDYSRTSGRWLKQSL